MAYDSHKMPDLGPVSPAEFEEHIHIGNDEIYPPFKQIYPAPTAYKHFPSLASGYNFHALGPPGAASGSGVWRVMREIRLTGTMEFADGDSFFDNNLNDVTSLSYS